MKRNILFKTLIDIAYYFLIPLVIFFPAIIIYAIVFPNQDIVNIQLGGESLQSFKAILFFGLFYIEFILFFIGFYEIRKLARLFLKKKVFTEITISKLKKIGQLFSICGSTSIVFLIIYKLTLSPFQLYIEFGFTDFQLLLFLTIIGVFFLLLSDAFKKAVQFKEENELTI